MGVKLGIRVRSQDANKPIVYEIVKLGLPASSQQFERKANKKSELITVENYYRDQYNLELKYVSENTAF
jgi:hypothetical protein